MTVEMLGSGKRVPEQISEARRTPLSDSKMADEDDDDMGLLLGLAGARAREVQLPIRLVWLFLHALLLLRRVMRPPPFLQLN
jgi:hypothetical protein